MKAFTYGDGQIGNREIMFSVPSILIGFFILSLPMQLSAHTTGSDGWIPIIVGGCLAAGFIWITVSLAARFPNTSFYTYTSKLISKLLACILTLAFSLHFILGAAYEVNALAFITKQYLLDRTPTEVIALTFLLVVIYAVAGERVGLFRLNLLFLPIILLITIVVTLLNLPLMEWGNYFPMFETSVTGYAKGTMTSIYSFTGFERLLFYIALMKQPEKAPKYACYGIIIVACTYLIVYIGAIGMFSSTAVQQILFPSIEMAREIEVPGGFFERFASIYITIWVMTLFNVTALYYDAAVFALNSIFKKFTKVTVVFGLAPIIYVVSTLPQDYYALTKMATYLGYTGAAGAFVIPPLLLIIAKWRGIKGIA